jgi:hypothetical protein
VTGRSDDEIYWNRDGANEVRIERNSDGTYALLIDSDRAVADVMLVVNLTDRDLSDIASSLRNELGLD